MKLSIKKVLILFILIVTGQLYCAEKPGNHYLRLINNYLAQGEYDKALNLAEADPDVDYPDSLAWLKGIIYKFIEEPSAALDNFAEVIRISENPQLVNKAFIEIENLLPTQDSAEQMEILISLLDTPSENIYTRAMMKLAEVYEKNNLLEEANEIYLSFLQAEGLQDTLGLRVKMATNFILRKDYAEAVRYARKSQKESDKEFIPQGLYIEFMGYYYQNDYNNGLRPILKLYLDYPEYSKKFAIYMKLAELLVNKGEYMAAWYILEEYYPQAGILDRRIIDEEERGIIEQLQLQKKRGKLFHLFKPEFNRLLRP